MLRIFRRFLRLGGMARKHGARCTIRPQIEVLEDRAVPAVTQLGSTIIGLNNTGWYPPDTGLAAGPNYVVETVNERMGIFNKSTGALVSSQDLGTLFSGFYSGSIGQFDPQVMYDDSAGRFVIAVPTTSGTSGNGPFTAYIDFAISNTSDPTQGWITRQIEVDQGGANWVDNGKLGYNADALVYSGNRYGSAGGVMVLSIDKSTLGNSNWTTYLVDRGADFSTIPARMHGTSSGGPMWFVESNWAGGNSVTLLKMTSVLSNNPTFATTSLSTNSYAQSTITQPGGSIGFDCRTLGAEWYNNNLVAAWNSQSGSDAAAFWIEFNTSGSPAVSQQGTVHPGSGISTAMPAIAVDAAGDVALTYIQSSSSQYPATYIAGRLSTDPVNTMTGNTLVQAGNASLAGSRIGDYAGLSLDPSSTNVFWAANEYGLSGVAGTWGTAIAQFQIASNSNVTPPTINSVTGSTTLDGTTGATTSLSVSATDDAGGADLTYSWSVFSQPNGVQSPTFSASTSSNTNVTFFAAGNYTIQVAVSNAGGTVSSGTAGEPANVSITVNQTATSIGISPASVTLKDGTKQQFTATVLDQFGNAMTSQPAVTWSANAPNGLYQAPSSGTGNTTVTATYIPPGGSTLTGTANISFGTVPAAPTSLTATAISARQIKLSWTDTINSSNNVTGYIIQRSTNGGSFVQIATVAASPGTTSYTYTDNNVQKKHRYSYRVAAYNGFGNSTWSNTATVSTPNRAPDSSDEDLPVVWVGPSNINKALHAKMPWEI